MCQVVGVCSGRCARGKRSPLIRSDVFLTPLKPKDKVVSAEDVLSCLYYIHYDRFENTGSASHSHLGINEPLMEEESETIRRSIPNIQRKPVLPNRPKSEVTIGKTYGEHVKSPPALLDSTTRAENRHNVGANLVHRKPLEPFAATHQRGRSEGIPLSRRENDASNGYGSQKFPPPQIITPDSPPSPPPHRQFGGEFRH